MIKSDAQRDRTIAQIEGFRHALDRAKLELSGRRAAAVAGSYEDMIGQLEAEVREYDELKRGKPRFSKVERLDQIAPFIARIRIAKGISRTELASRLGVCKQAVSRYEGSDCQTLELRNSRRFWTRLASRPW